MIGIIPHPRESALSAASLVWTMDPASSVHPLTLPAIAAR
jgi:hypothetical protein